MGGDGLGPTIPSTTGKKDHGSNHVYNTNSVIVILGNNKENKVNGFSLNKIREILRSQLEFQNCLPWERHTNLNGTYIVNWSKRCIFYYGFDWPNESERLEIKGKDDVFVFGIMLWKSCMLCRFSTCNFPATKQQLCLIRITSVPQLLSL